MQRTLPPEPSPAPRRRRAALVAVGLVIAVVAACTAPAPVSRQRARILNGAPVPSGGYPEVVALIFDGGNGGFCSGTLITSRVVLTAAHCMFGESGGELAPSAMAIAIGNEAPVNGGGSTIPVSAAYRHDGLVEGNAGHAVLGCDKLQELGGEGLYGRRRDRRRR